MADDIASEAEKRPKLWRYYRDRNLTLAEVGKVFGKTAEWVRLVCLPFDDAKRRVPSPEDVETAYQWSEGEIGPADWYPPHLSPPANVSSQPEGLAS